MKNNHKYFIVFALFMLSQMLIGQQNIEKATITFEFPNKKVSGSISGFTSTSMIDLEYPEKSIFEGSVAVKTLDTNNGIRNWHLKGGKYFDEDDYPLIYFKSTSVVQNNTNYMVKGKLKLKGVSKSIQIDFVKNGKQLKGTTSIYSSDYGISIKKKREDNLVKITMLFYLD